MDSVSPADNLSGGDVTPDLMNVSPLSGQEQESQGPASQGPAPMGGTSSMDALLHEREQLHSQTLQLKSHIHCLEADSSSVIDQMPPNELLKLYESLKEEYLQKTVAIDSQELLIRGEHLNEILLSIYNTADTDHDLQAQKRRVDDLQEEMRSLVAKIGTAQKQKAQMQNSLEKIKKENTESYMRESERGGSNRRRNSRPSRANTPMSACMTDWMKRSSKPHLLMARYSV
ncbi:uncharacterized protein LOC128208150 isoform X2 [Mya arenaria]|uniref:uncharacterized protein LOC128208150 isoform X2 n=1 Tax=Mya arenaria TaxID=6604 RepID=UPI0022E21AEA|nr:uncharacterized protein LOC128208150 isoform X2 [Mya arenaria]